jgi:signal transduction histidine kinase
MTFGQTVVGALNVYTGEPYRYSNQDIKILGALANLAAIAIEHARLHEKIVAVEEQLRRNERLSTLGLLAAEIAHEIRNPLTSMKMLFQALDLRFPVAVPRARDAEIVAEKMNQLNQIVDQLLTFARSTEPALERVDVNALLDDVLLLTRHRLNQQNIALTKHLAPDLPAVRADRHQMEQACLNLILNAVDAMPRGGTLTVSSAASNGFVALAFADTGAGMTAEQRAKLFEPFLTTKTKGTGLGLAIVKKTVEAHRGRIEVASQPGHGTTFRLFLPA